MRCFRVVSRLSSRNTTLPKTLGTTAPLPTPRFAMLSGPSALNAVVEALPPKKKKNNNKETEKKGNKTKTFPSTFPYSRSRRFRRTAGESKTIPHLEVTLAHRLLRLPLTFSRRPVRTCNLAPLDVGRRCLKGNPAPAASHTAQGAAREDAFPLTKVGESSFPTDSHRRGTSTC